ncbi:MULTISPECIES: glutamine--fructose-6-phosphate transaminase (isomerizing) [unclassified Crossiella]|uniref:glutamine--fructose-6-phosphate transaminase (isomerizing) n=1 Tax=unclassified Crossiella TaxID=2620835 RepID=UPI001FFFAE1B|nr:MULTISPECIES: glutamine--fructose-6-phosphate transaminase (isomerizing) [unclassified Crossiella]MCK2242032.1 glutamine--fructose-6-phosphate transaminase (isomerizing) [Crossiella sp. S99.2]MCK2255935.1 glutamine--fructose-6-phosphate transaminase (isomerizing) [Crossiella sp. S99.1]
MCGLVGYVGHRDAAEVLLEGLHRLEYRGYDSTGLAVLSKGRLKVVKAAVRVAELRELVPDKLLGGIGIAHTRWATHGEPTDANAHPHLDPTGRISLVHNGIIENAEVLRAKLSAEGAEFSSETDTEVLAHLVARSSAERLEDAVREALSEVEGTYGIVVLDTRFPQELVVARQGSPVVLGIGNDEMFIASDVAALVRFTQQVVYLDDGELATVRAGEYVTSRLDRSAVAKTPTTLAMSIEDYDRGGHETFLHKEIHEQPAALDRALRGRLDERFSTARLGGVGLDAREVRSIRRVKFLGSGSSYYAGQIGATLVEELARIPADAEPSSEFRYRNPVIDPDTLYIAVSQSGETADTLAAVAELKRKGGRLLGVVNVVGSAIARECGSGLFLHAGPEVSVAATKSFTNMAASFALLALHLGRVRDLSLADGRRLVDGLRGLPDQISEILAAEEAIRAVAHKYADARHMFFVGRVRGFPVAREGAQKLKEISYIHAEAYQSAELKHGPLALINPEMPSVVVIPADETFGKNLATIEEIKARGGPVIAVTNTELPAGLADDVLFVPRNEVQLDPVLLGIPLQLFAHHIAEKLGRDIDRPRNLAKSLTVE